jgi:hypothetical protein
MAKQMYCAWHPDRGYHTLTISSDAQTSASILMRLGETAGHHKYEIREYPSADRATVGGEK